MDKYVKVMEKQIKKEKASFFNTVKKLLGKSVSESSLVRTNAAEECIKSIVLDIPYTGTRLTSLRLYILIKGEGGLLSGLNSEHFDFKKYVLDGNLHEDKKFDTREIYKVFSAPVKTFKIAGNIRISVYISANDLIGNVSFNKLVALQKEDVFFGKSLIKG